MSEFFKLEKTDNNSSARAGRIQTDHSVIETPVFMPVGTQGTVKAIYQKTLDEIGAKIILGNTYHLYLRPGMEVMKSFKGLHKFMNWDKSILTDSGGYQVFSLKDLRKLTDAGVEFRSYLDGSKHFFSPENVVETQRILGSDILMVLDECTPYPATYKQAKDSIDLSYKWAESSRTAFTNSGNHYQHRQFQFAIGQGSMYKDLRTEYMNKVIDLDFEGYAIGGLSVGEPADLMYEMTGYSTEIMPVKKPRYLMGVGTPENILESISLGIDMFDCVMPTRNARNGQLFTSNGKINIKNAKFKLAENAIDETVDSYASRNFSLGYLRHLIMSNEILGLMLATEHNLAFYLWLVKTAREKILTGDFSSWKKEILEKINSNND